MRLRRLRRIAASAWSANRPEESAGSAHVALPSEREFQRYEILLDGPFRCGVLRHIPMHDPPRADFKDDKDVQRAEARRDGHEEIGLT